jgi:hypothetical protein
MSIRF